VRTGAGEAHPRLERARLTKQAMTELRRQIVSDRELGADEPVRLRVADALELTRAVLAEHVRAHVANDLVERFFRARHSLFFGEAEPVVGAPQVDERLEPASD